MTRLAGAIKIMMSLRLVQISFISFIFSLTIVSGNEITNPPSTEACQDLLRKVRRVSFSSFIFHAGMAGANIHKLVGRLETKYKAVNFQVLIPLSKRKLWILQEKEPIAAVMRKDAKLPFVNKNFDLSHGHFSSINSVDTTDELWKDLHDEMFEIFKNKKISPIMEKYKFVLTQSEPYNLNEALEEFFLKVWGEYSFGSVEHSKFIAMRNRLVEVLGNVFHKNKFNRIPFLGRITSKRNYRIYSEELKTVDAELGKILKESIEKKEGVFYELYSKLSPKYNNAFQIALDNSFLGVLVYDFIYIVVLDALTHIAKNPEVDRMQQFRASRHSGFLYPFRFREVMDDFDDYRKGDFCILNLQKSGLYFSSGPRSCPGAGLFHEITLKTLEIYQGLNITLLNPDEPIIKSPNKDLPFMTSTHQVRVSQCPFSRLFGVSNKGAKE